MDVDLKTDQTYAFASLQSWKSAGCPGHITRILLFAVAIVVTARLQVTATFHDLNHALSASVCTGALSGPIPPNGTVLVNSTSDFDWQSLQPSTDIEWTPCFDGQQCARLLLPLDYSNPTSNATTAITLRMIPARDRAHYRGTVLLNPGGPGGSGTSNALMGVLGPNISAIVGETFDMLGFNLRGIGASTPHLNCFASTAEQEIWNVQEGHQLLNASDDGLVDFYSARAKVVGDRCAQLSAAEGDIVRFMDTASVATDMLRITEKLGQEKLQYWGFSYGTVLGQYFAAIYPNKVGRMILDGVDDANDYRAALWDSLTDTEAVIASLFTFCHQAGSLACPIYESTTSAIRDRFYSVVDSVKRSPVPIVLAQPALVLTYKDVVNLILLSTYTPTIRYPILATAIRAIETANQTALAALATLLVSPVACDCSSPALPSDNAYEAFFAIACGDADPLTFDRGAFQAYFADLTRTAPTVAPLWATIPLGCTQWPVRPAARYTGPLAARNTSHPILIVQPRFDPVCPLQDALAVRGRYKGAGLLVQNSYGHTSLSAPSVCKAKVVRTYMEQGTLPKEGTVCDPDELPFVGTVSSVQARSEEDERLLDALRGLSTAVPMLARRGGPFRLSVY